MDVFESIGIVASIKQGNLVASDLKKLYKGGSPLITYLLRDHPTELTSTILQQLINHGAPLNAMQQNMFKHKLAIHYAAEIGDLQLLETILKNLSIKERNAIDEKGSALHHLIRGKHPSIHGVNLLIKYEIGLHEIDNFGYRAIYWAAQLKQTDIVELLLKSDGYRCMQEEFELIKEMHIQIVNDIEIIKYKDFDLKTENYLYYCLKKGNQKQFIETHQQSKAIEYKGFNFIMMACERNLHHIVDYLLNKNIYSNTEYNDMLKIAEERHLNKLDNLIRTHTRTILT